MLKMGMTDIRLKLCASANTKFQNMTQRDDLMSEERTSDHLIAMLWNLTRKYAVMFTAVYTDHHPDGNLGPHGHHPDTGPGYCVDLWPIYITYGNWQYIDAGSVDFQKFLQWAKSTPYLYEIGLAGTAYSTENMVACTGASDVFEDDGGDHVHLGVR